MQETAQPEESRQGLLVQGMQRLKAEIIGLGMHGSWTALALARMDIGGLRLWDADRVGLENLATQFYTQRDIGMNKAAATMRNLLTHGYSGDLQYCPTEWSPDQNEEPAHDVVICCADSMEVRQRAAVWARDNESLLFVESRSAGNQLFLHSFPPTEEAVRHYLDNFFPEAIEQVACGATGTVAVGLQVASLVASLVALTKGGVNANCIPNEHEAAIGLSYLAKAWPLAQSAY